MRFIQHPGALGRQAASAVLLALASLLPGCGKQAPPGPLPAAGAHRISGGTSVTVAGLTFDIPPGWTSRRVDDHLLLEPPPKSGLLWISVHDDPAVHRFDATALATLVPGMAPWADPALPWGAPEPRKCGDLDGFYWRAVIKTGAEDLEERAYGVMGVRGVVFMGMAGGTGRSDCAELVAIVSSLRAAPDPIVSEKRLFGQYEGRRSRTPGGPVEPTYLRLHMDKTYQIRFGIREVNEEGGAECESGTWSVAGDEITMTPNGGAAQALRLEEPEKLTVRIGNETWYWKGGVNR